MSTFPNENHPGVLPYQFRPWNEAAIEPHFKSLPAYADLFSLFENPPLERDQDGFAGSHGFGLSLFLSHRGHRAPLIVGEPQLRQKLMQFPLFDFTLALSVSHMSSIIKPTSLCASLCIHTPPIEKGQATRTG